MSNVHENLLHVTKYEVLGKLPDLFTFEDGTPVKTRDDWEMRRGEIYKTAVELQYGTLPPAPEFLEVETLYIGGKVHSYRIHTGTKKHPVSFLMKLMLPTSGYNFPAIVDGDMCFPYHLNQEFLSIATNENIAWVFFDRTELAHDIQGEGRRMGQLYDAYPDYTFGALGAWAWGYSRCVDALEIICAGKDKPLIDLSLVAFSGHSRGGKTAALAGAVDQRAAVVNPNETCAGACGCYRIHMEGYCDGIPPFRSETLRDLWNNFSFWMGPEMEQYADHEAELPFDAHFLKALVAPRVLFVSEAAGDIWSNPVGSWMTTMAAGKAYEFLGEPNNLYWYFREGTHSHDFRDVKMLVHIIKRQRDPSLPLDEALFKTPFPPFAPIY
ncbi:MAG: hypothetical protein E7645_03585 [Ruminococcaceae bacterium]|nr:hypothetical protein [Oscillospiraceae bacterium]